MEIATKMPARLSMQEVLQRIQTAHEGRITLVRGLSNRPAGRSIFRCDLGHEWPAPTYRVSIGHGCPICAPNRAASKTRYSDSKLKEILEKRNFKLLSSYTNMNRKANFLCVPCDKIVHIQVRQACFAPHGCPHCANYARRATGGHSFKAATWVKDIATRLRLKFQHSESENGEAKLDLGLNLRRGYTFVDGYNSRSYNMRI